MISYAADGTLLPLARTDRDWALFYMFAVTRLNADPIGFDTYIDWIRGRPFDSPDEWLGMEGDRFRARYQWKNPSNKFVEEWHRFKTANEKTSLEKVNEMMALFVHDL